MKQPFKAEVKLGVMEESLEALGWVLLAELIY